VHVQYITISELSEKEAFRLPEWISEFIAS